MHLLNNNGDPIQLLVLGLIKHLHQEPEMQLMDHLEFNMKDNTLEKKENINTTEKCQRDLRKKEMID